MATSCTTIQTNHETPPPQTQEIQLKYGCVTYHMNLKFSQLNQFYFPATEVTNKQSIHYNSVTSLL